MRHGCCEWWRLISSAIGTIAGINMFILFFIWGNYAAATFAICSGVIAAVCFHLAHLHYQNLLDAWHNVETLQGMTVLGLIFSLVGGVGFLWYIFYALYEKIPLLPMSDSAVLTAVWAGMTLKFGLSLMCYSSIYMREIYRETQPFLSA